MQACTKTHHFEIKNAKIFWGPPQTSPPSAPTVPRSTLKLNATPPEKNPSYGLVIHVVFGADEM